jgi:hypothetical protein
MELRRKKVKLTLLDNFDILVSYKLHFRLSLMKLEFVTGEFTIKRNDCKSKEAIHLKINETVDSIAEEWLKNNKGKP